MHRAKNNTIGTGSYGNVYGTADGRYAIKVIDIRDDPTQLHWVVEASVLNHFRHTKVPDLVNVTLDGKTCKLTMKRYNPLEEFDVTTICSQLKLTILRDIGEVLMYMHVYGLLHSDVKRRNVLLEIDNSIVQKAILCDYGLVQATSYSKLRQSRKYNTHILELPTHSSVNADKSPVNKYPVYNAYPLCSRPPEVVNDEYISDRSDVWAFGCLALSLHTRVEGIDLTRMKSITQRNVDYIVDNHTDDDIIRVICKNSLKIDPQYRASLSDMLGIYGYIDDNNCNDNGNDLATCIYNSIMSSNVLKPYEILFNFICKITRNADVQNHVRSLIRKWNANTTLSEDAVIMCIHLIMRYASIINLGDIPQNDVYINVMVCVNMAVYLFHSKLNIDVNDIYYDAKEPGNYTQAVCTMLELFNYNIFKELS